MNRNVFLFLAAMAAFFGEAVAQEAGAGAEPGMTIEEAAAVFEEQSFTAEIVDAYALAAEAWSHRFLVEGFNCGEARCTEFVFSAAFDDAAGFSLERINQWNLQEPAGRAFLNAEGAPMIDHVVSVGAPDDADVFYEGLLLWLEALEDFSAYLDEGEAAS